jgi:hypothetical protein
MDIEHRLKEIVDGISGLPARDRDEIRDLLTTHNEWGVALETLCAAIRDEQLGITQATYDAIRHAGEDMELEPATWEELAPLVRHAS